MKNTKSIALAVSLVVVGIAIAQEGRRHTETAGGFSYEPPENWQLRDFGKVKYKVAVGPINDQFAANINIGEEAFKGEHGDYVKATKMNLVKVFKKYKLVSEAEFKTSSGMKGTRLIVENEQNGKLLRQTFYLLGAPEKMFIITGSVAASQGDKLDTTFDKMAKSFRIEK
jgi:hypothetical protein